MHTVFLVSLSTHSLQSMFPRFGIEGGISYCRRFVASRHFPCAAAPGEQLGVQCLAQRHLSCGIEGGICGIEGGESAGYSLPPSTILPDLRLELATFGLRVQLSNH